MRESLYAVKSDIETREKRIQEVVTDENVVLSDDKVKAVVDKWEAVESSSNNLRPVLQVQYMYMHAIVKCYMCTH